MLLNMVLAVLAVALPVCLATPVSLTTLSERQSSAGITGPAAIGCTGKLPSVKPSIICVPNSRALANLPCFHQKDFPVNQRLRIPSTSNIPLLLMKLLTRKSHLLLMSRYAWVSHLPSRSRVVIDSRK